MCTDLCLGLLRLQGLFGDHFASISGLSSVLDFIHASKATLRRQLEHHIAVECLETHFSEQSHPNEFMSACLVCDDPWRRGWRNFGILPRQRGGRRLFLLLLWVLMFWRRCPRNVLSDLLDRLDVGCGGGCERVAAGCVRRRRVRVGGHRL